MNETRTSYTLISGALIVCALIIGLLYYAAQGRNTKDTLSVTGSAKTQVTSDQASLRVSLSRVATVNQLSSGYTEVARDLVLTRDMLRKEGVQDADISESTVSMNQIYDQNSSAPTRYELRQSITVQSKDVQKITAISKKIPSLSSQGVIISIDFLQYYYSKLPDLRVSLLSDAVKDAKSRAEKIAEGTGRAVGSIQSASSGVVQVLPVNSVEVSDYGSYDTSSIEKDVMVTVKASFRLR
ncbi:MAG: uncharacterized protein QG589_173 [Patescibacteria group bacterium]|nr:uncharacterized protein [Patescibacteria group bacterium]